MARKRKWRYRVGGTLVIVSSLIFGLQSCYHKINHTVPTAPSISQQLGIGGTNSSSVSSSSSSNSSSTGTNDSVTLSNLNYVSGESAIVEVNNNQSTLDPNSWKTNKVIYSNLDSFNRTSSPNTGYLEKRNVANDSLRVRQTVKPTGWHSGMKNRTQVYNRGHLIAYSVSKGISINGNYDPSLQSGDQNNLKNLFTQTAFSNQELQTIYEQKVRDALRANKKVIYQAQAIFRGNELMARGVHLQAISTDGSLNFNVYIFNVQSGYQFDYATGSSKVDRSMTVPKPPSAPHFNN